jgi:hypothetical protein
MKNHVFTEADRCEPFSRASGGSPDSVGLELIVNRVPRAYRLTLPGDVQLVQGILESGSLALLGMRLPGLTHAARTGGVDRSASCPTGAFA